MGTQRDFTLVCFAVPAESQYLRKLRPDLAVLHTGMGKENTDRNLRSFLRTEKPPSQIISSGFAGGLNPKLRAETVVMDGKDNTLPNAALESLDIHRGTFFCADRIAVTTDEKQQLWQSTKRDAIEMESGTIHEIAQAHHIPCLTLRVISDPADIELPLDFNQLVTRDMKMNYPKLISHLILNPGKISNLIRFNQSIQQSAKRLAETLSALLPLPPQ